MEKEREYLKNIEATEHAQSLEELKQEKIDNQIKRERSEREDEVQRSLHEEKRKAVLKKELKNPMTFTPHGDTLAREEEYRTDWVKKEPEQKQKKSWWKSLGQMFKKTATIGGATLIANSAIATTHTAIPKDSTIENNAHEQVVHNENAAEISDQLRSHWNSYVDWLDAQHMRGDKRLDHDNLGMKMLERFNEEHPDMAISPAQMKNIQKEFDKFREYVQHRVDIDSAGFRSTADAENFMKGLSKVDGWPGSRTTSYKFPEYYMMTLRSNTVNYHDVAGKVLEHVSKHPNTDIAEVVKTDPGIAKVEDVGFSKRETSK